METFFECWIEKKSTEELAGILAHRPMDRNELGAVLKHLALKVAAIEKNQKKHIDG